MRSCREIFSWCFLPLIVFLSGNAAPADEKVAIVTLVTTHSYVAGALVLAASLDHVKSQADRIVLVPHKLYSSINSNIPEEDALTEEDLHQLQQIGWKVHAVDPSAAQCKVTDELRRVIQQKMPSILRYWGTCYKFVCWSLTDYDAILYIDADGIALNNPDDLFLYTRHAEFGNLAAVPAPCPSPPCDATFQTALLLIKPSMEAYQYLQTIASQKAAPEGELQLLNAVFQKSALQLPKYTMVASTHSERPRIQSGELAVDWSQVTTYDFAGPPDFKPWNTYRLQTEAKDKFLLPQLGKITPDSPMYHNLLYPQWLWNDYYEDVLHKLKERQEEL